MEPGCLLSTKKCVFYNFKAIFPTEKFVFIQLIYLIHSKVVSIKVVNINYLILSTLLFNLRLLEDRELSTGKYSESRGELSILSQERGLCPGEILDIGVSCSQMTELISYCSMAMQT